MNASHCSVWIGRAALCLALAAAWPSVAAAQDRFFAEASGGVTFGTTPSADVGGRGGVAVVKHVTAFVEAGRLLDVLPTSERNNINRAAALAALPLGLGTPIVTGRLPAVYAMGGARFTLPFDNGRIGPFAEAAVGTARLSSGLAVKVDGQSLTSAVLTQPLVVEMPESARLTSIGGGMAFSAAPHTSLEFGIRYVRIDARAEPIGVRRVYGAVRLGF